MTTRRGRRDLNLTVSTQFRADSLLKRDGDSNCYQPPNVSDQGVSKPSVPIGNSVLFEKMAVIRLPTRKQNHLVPRERHIRSASPLYSRNSLSDELPSQLLPQFPTQPSPSLQPISSAER